jgi:hypothetical protein
MSEEMSKKKEQPLSGEVGWHTVKQEEEEVAAEEKYCYEELKIHPDNIGIWKRLQRLKKVQDKHVDAEACAIDINRIKTEEEDRYVFCKVGNCWRVTYDFTQLPAIPDFVGMQMIHYLLSNPNKEIHAVVLVTLAKSGDTKKIVPDKAESSYGIIPIDAMLGTSTTLKNYRNKQNEIKSEIEEAEENNDIEKQISKQKEYDELQEILTKGIGAFGRLREFSSNEKRAAKTARKDIDKALKEIRTRSEELYNHLDEHITLGIYASYTSRYVGSRQENIPDWVLK